MRLLLRKWWLVLAWGAVIVASSSTYVSSKDFVRWMSDHTPLHMTQEQFASFWARWWWVFVKGYHVVEFTVLFLLSLASLRKTRLLPATALLIAYAATAGYAALDEWHQTFVPLRGGRLTDFLIDLGGATVVTVWMLLSLRAVRAPRRVSPPAATRRT